ncbi:hypothetical protein BH11BAC5_BH11BAC5_23970 [soil metagenome]
MKKIIISLLLVAGMLPSQPVAAQAAELEQLSLNIEKLAQFKQILADMKKGYAILYGGYQTISDISKGNFDLHKIFLDGLLKVSPAVRNYKRVGDIIRYQLQIVSEYKTAFQRFKSGGWFNAAELNYITQVYGNLFDGSVKNLDDLFTVLTADKLRMNDEERLAAIDKIYSDVSDKLSFLRSFNNSTAVLALQRAREAAETKKMQQVYNVK